MNTSPCCEKCDAKFNPPQSTFGVIFGCRNADCPCHRNTSDTWEALFDEEFHELYSIPWAEDYQPAITHKVKRFIRNFLQSDRETLRGEVDRKLGAPCAPFAHIEYVQNCLGCDVRAIRNVAFNEVLNLIDSRK